MIYNDLEFHNVVELRTVNGINGLKLERFPKEIQNTLGDDTHHRGRFFSERAIGCEIRFVTDADFFSIGLTAIEQDTDIIIYQGDFFHSKHTLKAGILTSLHIEKGTGFNAAQPGIIFQKRFAKKVWRILIGFSGYVFFNYIDTFGYFHRPPLEDEKPSIKWLAYGSSITYGGQATNYTNCYANQTALNINADLYNKGIAGSCRCEKQIADFFAKDSEHYDLITLELGINMLGAFSPEEFELRSSYLVKQMLEHHQESEIFLITIFPHISSITKNTESKNYISFYKFNEILRGYIKSINSPKLHLIEGSDILTDFSFITLDGVHPSDDGHIRMGMNLGRIIKSFIN